MSPDFKGMQSVRFWQSIGNGTNWIDFFFYQVTSLIDAPECQYEIANQSYAEYIIERLEFCIVI